MNRFNPKTLLIAIAILAIAIYFGLPKILDTEIGKKLNLQKKTQESVSVSRVMLPDAPPNIESTSPPLPIPSNELANVNAPEIRYQIWAWNSQMGMLFANGGAKTTKGSIMEKRGVNLTFIRQDDVPQMQASLIQFAKAYSKDKNTKEGVQFVSIMGDGAATFLAGVNPELEKIGDAFEKSEEKNIYTKLLNTHMYFLVDAIVEVLLGKPVKEFKDIIKTGEEIKATVKKIKPETFKSFVKHYKIVEHLIDILMVDPYEIEKRLVRMELED
jgi:hypothetical protein